MLQAVVAKLSCSEPVVGRDGSDLLLRNFEGRVFRYPDPDGTVGSTLEKLGTATTAVMPHM